MISINDLSYYIGDRPIYDNASLFIGPKDRIGLIGLNGTGKSTLLKMIVGDVQKTSGEINMSNETTIGFLNQDLLSYMTDDSILQVAMQAFKETLKLQEQIDQVLKEMEENYRDELVDQLAKLQDRFETNEGYSMQAKAEEILEGIGFSTEDLQRPLREFSGGWRMRVMLAKLLLEKPSLLMLDEPTNHLDLPSIQWLETYLQSYEGACIIVSHDRRFLNASINKIVEVSGYQLNLYSGNYDFYLKEKEMRNEIQQNAFENQQQKIREAERFIERFKAKATKAKQAQSRVKMLEKMDRINAVVDDTPQVDFKFTFRTKSGRHVARLQNVSKSYDDLEILENTDAHIERGDKIAFIGANGKGKSTALRIVAGTEPHEGTVETGHNVTTAFYAQHQLEALNVENEILEELKQAGSGKTEQELRGVLGCFLFSDDEVFKKIKVLSGGEKSRVALAKTLISESNFLMLDEPTNHLDMMSVGILVQALKQFEGTFLLVSHDRDFISKVATKIWYIEDKQIKEYPGTYEEWEWWYNKEQEKKKASQVETAPAKKEKTKAASPKPKPDQESKAIEKEIKQVEGKIEALEADVNRLEADLARPDIYEDQDQMSKTTNRYQSKKAELEKLNTRWEELVEKLG
ncbi:ABC-F family ATP-binding cassette domain-containing protein [Marinoscillum furvescens]|uniref:Probable ATP-binding protein YbiT n=1 Tax=Marinoscillum furvescens DSM 4134 TaxID=1122208 RepID=A0A3D9KWT3_MARFU|nr:ABC-F family ATP-binding cassette domain-containing protein [Marinoscillum furvescens]RED91769.1 ATP-binding cassette subfamily F protein 3 [Marinoscillum furvescens DSM 4134]